MRLNMRTSSVSLWLSANDTKSWANRAGARWPCSQLAGHRIFAEFDSHGLCDLTIDGRYGDCDAHEFNACVADHLQDRLPENHECWFVIVGQFVEASAHV
jgi:hypothetical protein